eukprot:TRINITY_DN4937_c0_g1_i1.p1 TRINITY_DN4937_c0_g1~~TRINITY_DN4937_c0_g1_i1.p1  ORF type:complete len:842 (-),score=314.04 TRINITY_DN4937_c0_g1_i1:212-2713(-)
MPSHNKKHKARFASKTEQKKRDKGRTDPASKIPVRQGIKLSAAGSTPGTKLRNLQSSTDKRKNKRAKVLEERRVGSPHGPPKIVGLVGLSTAADATALTHRLWRQSAAAADPKREGDVPRPPVTCVFPEFQRARLSLVPANSNLDRQVDVAKVADIAVLVIRAAHDDVITQASMRSRKSVAGAAAPSAMDDDFDDLQSQYTMPAELPDVNQYGMCIDAVGQKFLSIMQAVGQPTVVVAVVGMDEVPTTKLKRQMLRLHTVYFRHFFSDLSLKVVVCDGDRGVTELIRCVAATKVRPIHWRSHVPYLIAEQVEWREPTEKSDHDGGALLAVSGYLRGRPLSPDILVHITHIGTFQVHSIVVQPDPCPAGRPLPSAVPVAHEAGADAEPLAWIKDVDPMANEQTWPTEEDLGDAPGDLPDDSGEDDEMASAHGAETASTKSRRSLRTEVQTQIDSLVATDLSRLERMTPEQRETERKHFEEQRRTALGAATEDRDYPDEVDAPPHMPARHRFLRYRGLASFRTSKWDPYENLPLDYGRIFQFHNMRATQKRAWSMFEEMPVRPDSFVTLVLKGVPREAFDAACNSLGLDGGFLTVSGLRRHEHKWSIMHYNLQFSSRHTQPIKSKESVLMHVGFRILRCNPIYSEPTVKGDKVKFMRFFHPADKFAVASVYAPINYPPMPVLVFKTPELDAPTADLVAWGSVLGADPCRVILKKVVLTGQVYRVHKRQAVVRFMFYDEKDINWFKPVELYTKLGHAGRILGSLGTHGYMKCQMSGIVRGEDTVCMALYKRVFPKWTTVPCSWLPVVEQQFKVPSLEDHGPETEDMDVTPAQAAAP